MRSFSWIVILATLSFGACAANGAAVAGIRVSSDLTTSNIVDLSAYISGKRPLIPFTGPFIARDSRKKKIKFQANTTIPSFSASSVTSAVSRVVAVSRAPSAGAPSMMVASTIEGLRNDENPAFNDGSYSHPPDQAICVGSGYIIEGVNSAWRIFNEATGQIVSSLSNDAFYNIDSTGFGWADPICTFDYTVNRFLTGIMLYDGPNSESYLVYSTNMVAGSVATWKSWKLQTSPTKCGDVSSCFDDYPQMGFSQHGLFLSSNVFGPLSSSSYQFSRIFMISKSQIVALESSPTTLEFRPDTWGMQVQNVPSGGAWATANGGTAFFVTTGSCAVGAIYNTASIDSTVPNVGLVLPRAPSPALTAYSGPDNIPQPTSGGQCRTSNGNYVNFDGLDNRLANVYYVNGVLYTAFAILGTSSRMDVRVVAIRPNLSPNSNPPVYTYTTLADITLRHSDGVTSFTRPTIAVGASGRGVILVLIAGPTKFVSIGAITIGSDFSISSFVEVASGAGPYNAGSGASSARLGDYSAIQVLGDSNSFWLAGEYVPTRTTCWSQWQWGTKLFKIVLNGATPTRGPTPTRSPTLGKTPTRANTPSRTRTPTRSSTATRSRTRSFTPPRATPTPVCIRTRLPAMLFTGGDSRDFLVNTTGTLTSIAVSFRFTNTNPDIDSWASDMSLSVCSPDYSDCVSVVDDAWPFHQDPSNGDFAGTYRLPTPIYGSGLWTLTWENAYSSSDYVAYTRITVTLCFGPGSRRPANLESNRLQSETDMTTSASSGSSAATIAAIVGGVVGAVVAIAAVAVYVVRRRTRLAKEGDEQSSTRGVVRIARFTNETEDELTASEVLAHEDRGNSLGTPVARKNVAWA
mmetsp:Transcript_11558/g.19672  ORF Transcript_11558/g.19672 Transcript_11558/m.19672 type:complete len:859 (+) Transcript_11558:125-2701(+)|eukprot:CAMPEP_0184658964 /NCGR_PEP_ID=MMETSP0308-20130426/27566_1 /TAXON_ID=38269 /ORGANISM="Gloeochaete witrockiana, Strain SAG 46.84" /LENGTH=858 /DNA_ID=CAMNT_0027098355 /DNA_START=76 /DNA_END=2652 /DNA_ORIENTATION=+